MHKNSNFETQEEKQKSGKEYIEQLTTFQTTLFNHIHTSSLPSPSVETKIHFHLRNIQQSLNLLQC